MCQNRAVRCVTAVVTLFELLFKCAAMCLDSGCRWTQTDCNECGMAENKTAPELKKDMIKLLISERILP